MNWTIFYLALPFVFIAALPGRTTFVMALLATRGQPLAVFIGSALAFLCQGLISVGLGRVFAFFPQFWIQLGAGLLFVDFSYSFWRESRKKDAEVSDVSSDAGTSFLKTFRSCFFVVFAAEWGTFHKLRLLLYRQDTTTEAPFC